ncbi:hypothetical protein Leryth_021293 [Lithospermum erythrorhizon]|nr:hypothetical protein Leryth_021293 [Lithospermum erythrorhizon]
MGRQLEVTIVPGLGSKDVYLAYLLLAHILVLAAEVRAILGAYSFYTVEGARLSADTQDSSIYVLVLLLAKVMVLLRLVKEHLASMMILLLDIFRLPCSFIKAAKEARLEKFEIPTMIKLVSEAWTQNLVLLLLL